MMRLNPPLTARDGHTVQVLAVARISTEQQDERSLEDQEALYRSFLDENCPQGYQLHMIAGQGSGERLDRADLRRITEELETERFDVLLGEDLARFCRRIHAVLLCELGEDVRTRVITLNDHIDTAQPNWKTNALFASLHHECSNEDTSNRIRRSLRNRFANGGVMQFTQYGYIKPAGAENDSDVRKNPSAEPVYDRWFQMLEDGATFADVADWLNAQKISPGPYCRNKQWDCAMVGRVTRNPILKGMRRRNTMMTKRENRTGQRKSIKAPPEELLVRDCPHLAFIDPERYDRVIALVSERNAWARRAKKGQRDPRAQIPKKRTRFPGQAIFCGVCGRMYVYGAHKAGAYLMCQGAREHHCWLGATCPEVETRERICNAVFAQLEQLPEFDAELIRHLREQEAELAAAEIVGVRGYESALQRIDLQLANVVKFIRNGDDSATLRADLAQLEQDKSAVLRNLADLRGRGRRKLVLPTAEELRAMAREAFAELARDSFEFSRQMRRVTPRIVVFPYQLCDGGKVVLRARFNVKFSALIRDPRLSALVAESIDRTIEVDLFDTPQREKFRTAIMQLRSQKISERLIATQLGLTITATQRAAAMQRKMDALGIIDPYVPLTSPPPVSRKLRRHLHARYSFLPLEDAGQL